MTCDHQVTLFEGSSPAQIWDRDSSQRALDDLFSVARHPFASIRQAPRRGARPTRATVRNLRSCLAEPPGLNRKPEHSERQAEEEEGKLFMETVPPLDVSLLPDEKADLLLREGSERGHVAALLLVELPRRSRDLNEYERSSRTTCRSPPWGRRRPRSSRSPRPPRSAGRLRIGPAPPGSS
jgi:hypothetical protein